MMTKERVRKRDRSLVVFDLGGVVFHWNPEQLVQEVLPDKAQNGAATRWVREIFQPLNPQGDWAQFDLGLIEPPELAERIAARTGLTRFEALSLIEAIPAHMRVKQDTLPIMETLAAQGHRLVYLSNMPHVLCHWIEKNHSFSEWFSDGLFSARAGLIKPDPSIYRALLHHLGCEQATPIFVDDMQSNVQAAEALGWTAIRFDHAAQVQMELVTLGLLR
jgi:FMN phosphatase YigB (HAD superfamily)